MSGQGVFVFAEDGVQFFTTVEEAAAYVEAVDVENGVYEAFISLDGERLIPRPIDVTTVHLQPSGDRDAAGLVALLAQARSAHGGFASNPSDPAAVANELLTHDWEARWPKWPRWLDKRLHGAQPPHVETI